SSRRWRTSSTPWTSSRSGDPHTSKGGLVATKVTMPQLGETVVEGTILKWLKQEGESIGRDEPLFEISTDKVDTEVPSPVAGKVVQIKVPEGETVQVGTELALIESDGQAGGAAPKEKQAPRAESEPEEAEQAEEEGQKKEQEAPKPAEEQPVTPPAERPPGPPPGEQRGARPAPCPHT